MIVLWTLPFSPIKYALRLCLDSAYMREMNLYHSFCWSSLILCTYNEHVHEELSCQTFFFFGKVTAYQTYILDSSFLYWPILCRRYLISIAYFSFHLLQNDWHFSVTFSKRLKSLLLNFLSSTYFFKWASSCENSTYNICEHLRLRQACTSVQSHARAFAVHSYNIMKWRKLQTKSHISGPIVALLFMHV